MTRRPEISSGQSPACPTVCAQNWAIFFPPICTAKAVGFNRAPPACGTRLVTSPTIEKHRHRGLIFVPLQPTEEADHAAEVSFRDAVMNPLFLILTQFGKRNIDRNAVLIGEGQ